MLTCWNIITGIVKVRQCIEPKGSFWVAGSNWLLSQSKSACTAASCPSLPVNFDPHFYILQGEKTKQNKNPILIFHVVPICHVPNQPWLEQALRAAVITGVVVSSSPFFSLSSQECQNIFWLHLFPLLLLYVASVDVFALLAEQEKHFPD